MAKEKKSRLWRTPDVEGCIPTWQGPVPERVTVHLDFMLGLCEMAGCVLLRKDEAVLIFGKDIGAEGIKKALAEGYVEVPVEEGE